MIQAAPDGHRVKKIRLILGLFHVELSFFGAVGTLMEGPGLQKALEQLIAKNSVPQVLSGKAQERAFRARMLAATALNRIILKMVLHPTQEGDEDTTETEHRWWLWRCEWGSGWIKTYPITSFIIRWRFRPRKLHRVHKTIPRCIDQQLRGADKFWCDKCNGIVWYFRLSFVWYGQLIDNHAWCDVNWRCLHRSPATPQQNDRYGTLKCEDLSYSPSLTEIQSKLTARKKNFNHTGHPTSGFSTWIRFIFSKCIIMLNEQDNGRNSYIYWKVCNHI